MACTHTLLLFSPLTSSYVPLLLLSNNFSISKNDFLSLGDRCSKYNFKDEIKSSARRLLKGAVAFFLASYIIRFGNIVNKYLAIRCRTSAYNFEHIINNFPGCGIRH